MKPPSKKVFKQVNGVIDFVSLLNLIAATYVLATQDQLVMQVIAGLLGIPTVKIMYHYFVK